MSRARVLLAGFYPPPYAGEPIHVKQLAHLLRGQGLQVDILNLNRHAPPSSEYLGARSPFELVRLLYTAPEPRSVLHLHTNGHSWRSWAMITAAAMAGRFRGVTGLLTLHSGLLPGYVNLFRAPRRMFAGWVLRSFARVIAVNDEIAAAVSSLTADTSRVRVIPAFLGITTVPGLSPEDRAAIRDLKPLIVAVAGGEEDPEHGLSVVVRALPRLIERFPGVGAVLIGWQTGPKTNALIAELGLGKHARCLGEVSHERCLSLLRAADVVVRSTFLDGDAITVREALALGVPVVASDTGLRPRGVVLFRKGEIGDLVAQLTGVLKDQAPSLVGPGTPDHSAEELWQTYAELIDQDGVRACSSRVGGGTGESGS